jgi:hypothetical protein
MNVDLQVSPKEAEAILRAELSVGYGVRRSLTLQAAEFKLRQALISALKARGEGS